MVRLITNGKSIPYESISYNLWNYGNIRLNHKLTLGRKDKFTNSRLSPVMQYSYNSEKYIDNPKLKGLSIGINSYLSFDIINKENKTKMNYCINEKNMLQFKFILDEVLSWFDRKSKVYLTDDRKNFYVNTDIKIKKIKLLDCFEKCFLTIKPTTKENKLNENIPSVYFQFTIETTDNLNLDYQSFTSLYEVLREYNLKQNEIIIFNTYSNLRLLEKKEEIEEVPLTEDEYFENRPIRKNKKPGFKKLTRNKNTN